MTVTYRPMLQVLREALHTLQTEPGPMTPEKKELLSYLRERIVANQNDSAPFASMSMAIE